MTQYLPTDQLQPNPFQPRDKIKKEEVADLALSIKSYGILEPIVVAQTPAGYQIIAGERRWRAAQMVELKEVPVHIKKTTPKGMLEMALVENVQRVDLNPLERAQAFMQLMRNFHYTNAQLSQKVGKSPSYISNSLKLLELPDAVTDGLISNQISEGHARALSGIENEQDLIAAYKIILKKNGSVRFAEEIARNFKNKNQSQQSSSFNYKYVVSNEIISKWEHKIKQLLNSNAKLKLSRSQKQTKITIILNGSLEETQLDLEKIINLSN